MRHPRPADRRVRHQGQVSRPRGGPAGYRQRGVLRRAGGQRDQRPSARRERRAAAERPDPERRRTWNRQRATSAGTAPTPSASTHAGHSRPSRSRLSKQIGQPVSALLNFTAAGSGRSTRRSSKSRGRSTTCSLPTKASARSTGSINVDDGLMTLQLEAASPRLSVSVVDSIAMTPEWDANIRVKVLDTSLDPYVRLFLPQFRPTPPRSSSGSVQIRGELKDIDHLLVDATVDSSTCGCSITRCATRGPSGWRSIVILFASPTCASSVRTRRSTLPALPTCTTETINMRANGDANLACSRASSRSPQFRRGFL